MRILIVDTEAYKRTYPFEPGYAFHDQDGNVWKGIGQAMDSEYASYANHIDMVVDDEQLQELLNNANLGVEESYDVYVVHGSTFMKYYRDDKFAEWLGSKEHSNICLAERGRDIITYDGSGPVVIGERLLAAMLANFNLHGQALLQFAGINRKKPRDLESYLNACMGLDTYAEILKLEPFFVSHFVDLPDFDDDMLREIMPF